MNTKRICLLASMALAAIAFAAPAVAQANVFLTEPAGTKVGLGKEIRATSFNLVVTSPEGITLTCASLTLRLEVVANGPTHVNLKQLAPLGASGCLINNLFPVTLQNGGFVGGILTINTWGTANVTSTFISRISETLECHHEGSFHIVGKGVGTDQIELKTSSLSGSGEGFCAATHWKADFTLETSNGTSVTLDYVATG